MFQKYCFFFHHKWYTLIYSTEQICNVSVLHNTYTWSLFTFYLFVLSYYFIKKKTYWEKLIFFLIPVIHVTNPYTYIR